MDTLSRYRILDVKSGVIPSEAQLVSLVPNLVIDHSVFDALFDLNLGLAESCALSNRTDYIRSLLAVGITVKLQDIIMRSTDSSTKALARRILGTIYAELEELYETERKAKENSLELLDKERQEKEQERSSKEAEMKAKEDALKDGDDERHAKEEAIKGRKREKKLKETALKEKEEEKEAKESALKALATQTLLKEQALQEKADALRVGEEERRAKEEAIKGRKREKKLKETALQEKEEEREAKETALMEFNAEKTAKEEALRELVEAEAARDENRREIERLTESQAAAEGDAARLKQKNEELEREVRDLKAEVEKLSKQGLPYSIYWLDSVPLHLYTSHVKKDGNTITHIAWGLTTFIIGAPMTSGVFRIKFLLLRRSGGYPAFGLIDSSLGYPSVGQTIMSAHKGVQMFSSGHTFRKVFTRLGQNQQLGEGDELVMEVDLRSTEPDKRTLRWFIRDVPQPIVFTGLPEKVEFAISTCRPGTSVEFVSLEKLAIPTVTQTTRDRLQSWE